MSKNKIQQTLSNRAPSLCAVKGNNMVYQNKIVAAIKVAGKILRENSNTVTIPFGAEYSVFIKNMDSRRVQVKVSVDGTDATEGTWLIIPQNGSIELERFIRNGNFESGNRFKFIERTREVEAHRGIRSDDGLIRVEYKRELVVHEEETIVRRTVVDEYDPWYVPWPRRPIYPRPRPFMGSLRRIPTRSMGPQASGRSTPTSANRSSMPSVDSARRESERGYVGEASASMDCAFDPGITVPGSESNQRFIPAEWFATESQSEVLVIKLRGKVGDVAVQKAVTVEHKPQCSSCGRVNNANASFCSRCGTALQLI